MKSVKLIFGTHNSQPVGVGNDELEEAYQTSYKPFLTHLYNHQGIRAVLHYAGLLLSWFEERHPEFLMLLNDMVKRKQVELLGGGYYEPVLPLIPSADRSGQIELLTTFLRKRFGKRPRGGWIAERIWEPSLASTIKNSGMEYVFLDERHLISAGFAGTDLRRPCITEDQGKTLFVYPISGTLRRMVPTESPAAVVSYLLSLREEDSPTVAFVEDGEKYGLWEKNGKRIYGDGWLEDFFTLLVKEKGKIDTTLPSGQLRGTTPIKKGYFSCTSYEDMMSWIEDPVLGRDFEKTKSRATDKGRRSAYSGYFRQFLSRYPESNALYSKVMYTHVLVNQIRGDRARKKAAQEELWRGECHNVFWHGMRGGIYENKLRKASYGALIEAEKVTREKGIFKPSTVAVDFDMDGENEYLYQGLEFNSYIHRVGGVMFELDHIKEAWNYLDTLGRHREPYHDDSGSSAFDWYPRRAFVDHFFQPNENINSFDRMTYRELGDFITKSYRLVNFDRERNELRLAADGEFAVKAQRFPVELRKRYLFRRSSILVAYTVVNTSEVPLHCWFGSEINLSLSGNTTDTIEMATSKKPNGEERSPMGLGRSVVEDASEVVVRDLRRGVSIDICTSSSCRLWSLPVETLSRALSKMERNYQSTCVVPQWSLSLKPGETWAVEISLSVGR